MMWLVPGLASSSDATVWLRAVGAAAPARVTLQVADAATRTPVPYEPRWRTFVSAATPRHVARVSLRGLKPDTMYRVRLAEPANLSGDEIRFQTLPARLPRPGEAPLRIFLGSCFSPQADRGAGVRNLAREFHLGDLPHLKILCGDQVYLDLPVTEVLPDAEDALRRTFLAKYEANWAPAEDRAVQASGYGDLLRAGANLFVGDDHEFWNNYPFWQFQLQSTWSEEGRRWYTRAAKELFCAYQADLESGPATGGLQLVKIGEGANALEIAALDGRYFRTDRLAYHPGALERVTSWLAQLTGPALLVLSQPLFEPPSSGPFRRERQDANLTDFADFGELLAALARVQHDVVILSGDIHGGRLVRTQGGRLTEVVSSPLTLLQPGSWHERPPVAELRDRSRNQGTSWKTVADTQYPLRMNHYALLELVQSDAGAVSTTVRFFEVRSQRWPTARRTETLKLI